MKNWISAPHPTCQYPDWQPYLVRAHFTTEFCHHNLDVIHFHCALIWIWMNWSLHNFAHDMTAVLPWNAHKLQWNNWITFFFPSNLIIVEISAEKLTPNLIKIQHSTPAHQQIYIYIYILYIYNVNLVNISDRDGKLLVFRNYVYIYMKHFDLIFTSSSTVHMVIFIQGNYDWILLH